MAARRLGWTLLGIPIHFDSGWFVVVALLSWSLARYDFPLSYPGFPQVIYWAMGLATALLLFACVLLHELGHSVVARSHGIPVACVTLFLFGGVAQITESPKRPSVELQVALAGPLVSVLIAAGCLWGAVHLPVRTSPQRAVAIIVHYLGIINIGLAFFNMLPGYPLDGGRVLRASLWAWTGNLRRATRVASLIGCWFGFGLIALGIWRMAHGGVIGGLWHVFLGWFLRNAAMASYRRAQ